jgi:hypothetical protein
MSRIKVSGVHEITWTSSTDMKCHICWEKRNEYIVLIIRKKEYYACRHCLARLIRESNGKYAGG